VSAHKKKQTHRKGAKNAKFLIVFIKEFLSVFAVKAAFMEGRQLTLSFPRKRR
jgi:hypothetical protein